VNFGLFGGARVSDKPTSGDTGGMSGDSLNLNEYISYVLLAEELGFSNVFMVEHHFTGGGQVSSSIGLLTYLAARTSRIRLGTAVVVLPWHNPALLAESVATLDLLSGGRFDFGIGKGYKQQEFDGFAMDPAEAGERFEETLSFLRRALSSRERFSHSGKFWTFRNVVIEPQPVQTPHPPLWLAANSEASIRRAARDGCNLLLDQISPIDQILERIAVYRDEQKRAGIATPGQVGVTRGMHVVENEPAREQMVRTYATLLDKGGVLKFSGVEGEEGQRRYIASDAPLIGRPEKIIRQVRRLQDGGADVILVADMTGSPEGLRSFAGDVMSAFKSKAALVGAT
jgi:alkanesulfonate monooxygenase SsuD/methylene tetrahydromethanopterin reductase-like flavin-dependent oxidoreductase (luciferase family)